MIPLEHLADGSTSDRNFQKLMHLVLDMGGVEAGLRFGSGTATWPGGGAVSGTVTVTHRLGRTPVVAAAFPQDTLFEYPVTAVDATTLTITGCISTNTSVSASSRSFYWLVIG